MTTGERMGQIRLAIELRLTTDSAMLVNPTTGRSNPGALRRVKQLLREYPDALGQSHVRHNLGPRRIAWLQQVRDNLAVTKRRVASSHG